MSVDCMFTFVWAYFLYITLLWMAWLCVSIYHEVWLEGCVRGHGGMVFMISHKTSKLPYMLFRQGLVGVKIVRVHSVKNNADIVRACIGCSETQHLDYS